MSVYIKGMEMPKSCHECVAGYGGCCFVAPAESDGICPDHGRADFCPLIPVPDHGRLIDADALITKVTDAAIKQPEIADVYYEQASEIGGWLYSMPTIIPADVTDMNVVDNGKGRLILAPDGCVVEAFDFDRGEEADE